MQQSPAKLVVIAVKQLIVATQHIISVLFSWIYAVFYYKYSILFGAFLGASLMLVLSKILFFSSDSWTGLIVELLDKVINYFDKLVEYEPPKTKVSTVFIDTSGNNFSKLLWLAKKVAVWATVTGVLGYAGLFAVGLNSFSFSNII